MRRLIDLALRPLGPTRATVIGLLWLIAAALVVLVGARLLGAEQGSFWSASMALLPLLLALSFPLLVVAVLLRRQALGTLALMLVGTHVLLVAPSTGGPGPDCDGTPLRVVGANVMKNNPTPEAAGRALRALHADVLVMPEFSRDVEPGLRASGLFQDLPELQPTVTPFENTTIASRLPLSDPEMHYITRQREPRATVSVDGMPVRILGVHPLPPLKWQGPGWVRALEDLHRELQAGTTAQIAMGDFNSSRDFKSFRRLLTGGVRDAHEQLGQGLQTTWPHGRRFPPVFHLDHVLVKSGGGVQIGVCRVHQAEVPGSDHLAVVADLVIRRS